jgi:two-component system capsular synthesis sensor histidine kinase RcsC
MQDNRIELNLDIDTHRVVRIDRTLLGQLLNNLLLNKINLLQNEVIQINCSLASSRTDGGGTLLAISIEDEGPAFPDYVLQEVDKEPDVEGLLRIQQNSGLGLPICRRIASVMGGEIRFYNDAPKTRIRIWLPID